MDLKNEYKLRMKKFRKWSIYIAVWIVALFTVPFVVLAVSGSMEILALYMGITALTVMPAFIQMVRLCRCPACENFIGMKKANICPVCGTDLGSSENS